MKFDEEDLLDLINGPLNGPANGPKMDQKDTESSKNETLNEIDRENDIISVSSELLFLISG